MGEIYLNNCLFPLNIAALHCFTLLAPLNWVFLKQNFVPSCMFQPKSVSRKLVLSSLSNPLCYMNTHTRTHIYSFILSLSLSQLWLIIPTWGHFPKSLRKTCYCKSDFIPAFFLSRKNLLDNPFHHTSTEPSVPVFHLENWCKLLFFLQCSNIIFFLQDSPALLFYSTSNITFFNS